MSKTVTIPTGGGNPFVVILGGVKYVYKPGETVEVPDGVALEIEEWERWHEKYYGDNVPPFGAGGGTQPDLSQNDPNAPDFVKNRTHYEEVKHGAIIESQTVEIIEKDACLFGANAMPKEGGTYTVTLNGTQYECVAWYHDDWDAIILGNGSFVDSEGMGEDVPFAISFDPEAGDAYLNANEGTFSVEVQGEFEIVHKLDPKYLPQNPNPVASIDSQFTSMYINTSDVFEEISSELVGEYYDLLKTIKWGIENDAMFVASLGGVVSEVDVEIFPSGDIVDNYECLYLSGIFTYFIIKKGLVRYSFEYYWYADESNRVFGKCTYREDVLMPI